MSLQFNKLTILFLLLFTFTHSTVYSYNTCNSTSFLNTNTLKCTQCPPNTKPNSDQSIPNQCICQKGYYPTDDGSCTEYFTGSASICSIHQFIEAFTLDGRSNMPVTSCSTCDVNAFPDQNGTGCVPCFTQMTYNSTLGKCQCIDPTYVQTQRGCFPESYTSALGLTTTSSLYSNRLKYLFPGCYHFNDTTSCSQLINLCTFSLLSLTTPQCNFFTRSNLTNYLQVSNPTKFQLNNFDKSTSLSMKLIYFKPQGNYFKQENFKLAHLMRCGLPADTDMIIEIGNNFEIECEFNFNHLVKSVGAQSYQGYLYELWIKGQNDEYFPVNVYINSNSIPVKRFFLEDAFTSSETLTVMTSMTFQLTLNNEGNLVSPSLYLSYSKLTLQKGIGVTPTPSQWLRYQVNFTSSLESFWSVSLPIFIVIQVLILVHTSIRTYISYLNRKTPFLFFLNFVDIWSLWMFYFLLIMSGYWFLFTKTTPSVYTFISGENSLYVVFYVLFALMVGFRLIWLLVDKLDKLNIQVFLINWQRGKFRNSWREIFIINSLAEFATYRTFSVFWLMIVMLFFMTGIGWEKHAAEIAQTDLGAVEYFHPKNRIYLYFLSSSILLVITVIFKILRRLSVLFWPYPFQDFVDYCTVTNLSLYFMKKRSPQTYYIHAAIPDRADVSYKEINRAVRDGLNRKRSIANQTGNSDSFKSYIIYVNREIQDKFNLMLKKEQDFEENRQLKYKTVSSTSLKNTTKSPFHLREDFIEKNLKPLLEQQGNQNRTKTTFESMFHLPPIDLRGQRGLNQNQIIFDDKLDLVKEVFPNGDEFQQIHTILMIYLLWVIVTGSSPIAAFLTYFCDEYLLNGWIGSSYRKRLEKMTNVKEGFML